MATKAYLIFALRVLLGLIFLASGISKLSDIPSFVLVVKEFGFVSEAISRLIASAVPVIEIGCGVLLLAGLWVKASSAVIMGLLMMFIAVVIPQIAVGNEIDCGCFGPLSHGKVDTMLLVRDVILLALSLIVAVQRRYVLSIEDLFSKNKTSRKFPAKNLAQ